MSREELKKYLPDSPKEYAQIGGALARLGTAMSGVLLFAADKWWVIGSMSLTWLGHEINNYFKIHSDDNKVSNPDSGGN